MNGNTVKENLHAAYLKSQLSQSFGNENRFPRCITQNSERGHTIRQPNAAMRNGAIVFSPRTMSKAFQGSENEFSSWEIAIELVFYQIYFELLWAF